MDLSSLSLPILSFSFQHHQWLYKMYHQCWYSLSIKCITIVDIKCITYVEISSITIVGINGITNGDIKCIRNVGIKRITYVDILLKEALSLVVTSVSYSVIQKENRKCCNLDTAIKYIYRTRGTQVVWNYRRSKLYEKNSNSPFFPLSYIQYKRSKRRINSTRNYYRYNYALIWLTKFLIVRTKLLFSCLFSCLLFNRTGVTPCICYLHNITAIMPYNALISFILHFTIVGMGFRYSFFTESVIFLEINFMTSCLLL